MTTIGISDFVRRQTPESPFSYFSGTEEELLALVAKAFQDARPGYRDGVRIAVIAVPALLGFYSAVVEVAKDTPLTATFEARRDGEAPFIQVRAAGPKSPAKHVEVVLYSREVLEESGEASTGADFDIISINASGGEDEPMTPLAMARNFLALPGGTKAEYSAEEFARAIVYWSSRAMAAG